jgi:hypothetical protein
MKKWSEFLSLRERCWPGYKSVPGKKAYSPGSCVKEDLRQWFDKDHPKGGWKRINSKGEAIGPCAREPGEPKPKCMSNEKRAKLSKKERVSAVASKRKHDPNPERKGEPINVSNFGKGKISENMENLDEKNVPTSPEKWAQAKAQAKAKFDVYPSAYANGWASKKYKEMGGGWKSVSEENNLLEKWSQLGEEQHKEIDTHTEVEDGSHQDKNDTKDLHDRVKAAAKKHGATITYQDKPSLRGSHTISARGSQDFHKEVKHIASDYEHLGVQHDINEGAVPAQEKIITVKHKTSGKTLRISAAAAPKYRMQGYHYHPVNEAKDEQEYGYEGDMALNQLATLTRCAEMIKDLLKPDTDMPEWVQSKITLATDYIQTAADYMYSEMKDMKEEVEPIDELSNKTLYSYLRQTGAVRSSTEVNPRNTSNVPHDLQYQAQDSAKSRINARKGYDSVAPKGYAKEEVELDEADQKFIDSLNKLAKTHKVGDSVTVDSKFFGKQKGKVTKVDNQSVHVVRDGKKSAEKYPHNAVVKEASDNGGTIPTPAAETLTANGQQKLSKTVGQTKMIPFVHEAKETKPPFDGPYTTTKAVIKDKSGAKHTPMSRARDLARKAMARNMKEQSNVTPNPFTVPEIDIGKAPKKTKATMSESRQLEIVREAMKVAKKKKEEKVTEAGTDKFFTDPELASQITKS